MRIVARSYDHPDVVSLVDAVQEEYRRLYGGDGDSSVVTVAEFAEAVGWFAVVYEDHTPVAMGGWRRLPSAAAAPDRARAEIKRMYVVPTARGRGFSRVLLTEIEDSARAAGVECLVLETGLYQPAAIGLYRSAGYEDVTADFGVYCGDALAVHLGKQL